MPGVAHLAAAADVRVCDYHTAIKQRESCSAEADRQRIAVGAIAIDVQWTGPILLKAVATIDQRYRQPHAVRGLDPDALGGVERPIEASRHLLLLQQRRVAARHVVRVDRSRRDERGVAVTEDHRVELAIDVTGRGVDRLGDSDLPRFAELLTELAVVAEGQHLERREPGAPP